MEARGEGPGRPPLFVVTRCLSLQQDSEVRLCSAVEVGRRHIIALVIKSGDVVFYLSSSDSAHPTIRQVPWLTDEQKQIVAISFDPTGTWLLLATQDASLFLLPALPTLDPSAPVDMQWSTTDITEVGPGTQRPCPSAVVWWQTAVQQHVAILGSTIGDICFISLTTGAELGMSSVSETVDSLHICPDNSLDIVYLLVTGSNREQWRLPLEQHSTGYCWPLEVVTDDISDLRLSASCLVPPTARSRLQGLKQLSVEKLASLRQRLAETRKGAAAGRRESSASDDSTSSGKMRSPSDARSGGAASPSSQVTKPEQVSATLGTTFLTPQYSRGRYLFSGFYEPTNTLTVHSAELDVIPLFVHKLPPSYGPLLLTDRFVFATSTSQSSVAVVSTQLSEIKMEGHREHNFDSVIQNIELPPEEKVLALYKKTVASNHDGNHRSSESRSRRSAEREGSGGEWKKKNLQMVVLVNEDENSQSERKRTQVSVGSGSKSSSSSESRDNRREFSLPKDIKDVRLSDTPLIDTCVIITSTAIYETKLRNPPAELFMELVLKHREVEQAERLAIILGLNLHRLLEAAGDLKLAAKEFPQAIALYKLSKCRYLKSVLKFAASGHAAELLSYVQVILSSPGLDLAPAEKIHLANLAVMSHVEQLLRSAPSPRLRHFKNFLKFLQDCPHYDEVLAVSIASQTGLWEILQILAGNRGLHQESLEMLVRVIKSLGNPPRPFDTALDGGLWLCLSDPLLLQSLVLCPPLAKAHIAFTQACLSQVTLHTLQRLAALYDMSSPILYPALRQVASLHHLRRPSSGTSSLSSSLGDMADFTQTEDICLPVSEMIEMFLFILLQQAQKKSPTCLYRPELMSWVKKAERVQMQADGESRRESLPPRDCPLSAGYAHVAIVRNSGVFTWGNAIQGCLGIGPTMSRYGCPSLVQTFPALRVEVLSVACGKQHTLALTTNGVYAWGASQYGQLGVGRIGRSPRPILVSKLSSETIVEVAAGQYHSLALSANGKVFTWGWGVHGQLGHGSIEDSHFPTFVSRLANKVVVRVCGGYGHSAVLTSEGEVYTCGSGMFGQLGLGTTIKKSLPQKVALPEPIILMSTSYFHNLAVDTSNRLWIWGTSPQVLRLQAQAQKKARLLQQQPNVLQTAATAAAAVPETANGIAVDENTTTSSKSSDDVEGAANGDEKVFPDVTKKSSSSKIETSQVVEDDSLAHLSPQQVDTRLVDGKIVQVACGCHHSALLTDDGVAYVWGRNLDGQIGNNSRKEVPAPSPVRAISDRRIAHIACGCEFTVVMETGGQVWAWGNNSNAQLGRPPQEDSRAFDSRIVTLKTTKRVIKLPHGIQEAIGIPRDVPGLPGTTTPYNGTALFELWERRIRPPPDLPSLSTLEKPMYGLQTLHFALEHFHNYYDSSRVLAKCLELENYQAAAKLSAMDRHYHVALSYQLKALGTANHQDLFLNKESTKKDSSSVSPSEQANGTKNNVGEFVPSDFIKDEKVSTQTDVRKEDVVVNGVDSHDEGEVKRKDSSVNELDHLESKKDGGVVSDECDNRKNEKDKSSSDKHSNQIIEDLTSSGCEYEKDLTTEKEQQMFDSAYSSSKGGGETSEDTSHEMELVSQATAVVEHYVSLMEEDSHGMMKRLLEQGIEFWMHHALPVDHLETLLLKHMSRLFYPLGLMLFCSSASGTHESEVTQASQMLRRLSTRFCLQLCSTLLAHIDQDKPFPELMDLLSQLTLGQSSDNSENTDGGQSLQLLLARLGGQPAIHLTQDDVNALVLGAEQTGSQASSEVFVFTCGHHYPAHQFHQQILPEMEVGLLQASKPLPGTAQLLRKLFSASSTSTACPMCILKHVQSLT